MATPEPLLYSPVVNDRLTWLCVVDHCRVGRSKYIPCTVYGLMSANFPLVFFAFVAHTSPKPQRSTSMFHSWNSVPFIIGLVDTSPNVMFVVHFGVITPNDFIPEGLRLVLVVIGIL